MLDGMSEMDVRWGWREFTYSLDQCRLIQAALSDNGHSVACVLSVMVEEMPDASPVDLCHLIERILREGEEFFRRWDETGGQFLHRVVDDR